MRSELEAVRPNLAVVSCEGFAALDDSLVSRVAQHLAGHEVRVIVYMHLSRSGLVTLSLASTPAARNAKTSAACVKKSKSR